MLKWWLASAAPFFLWGCSESATIRSAWMDALSDNDIEVHTIISAKDAAFIKQNQIYFSVVVNECTGKGKRFPMEPMIANRKASDFDFDVTDARAVEVIAAGPVRVIKGYRTPCGTLEGGGISGPD